MLRVAHGLRGIATVSPARVAPSSSSLLTATSEEGFRLACLADPSPQTPLSRLTVAFNAGSRHETEAKDHGLTHLIRRAFGLSTSNHTAVNLTRHFQQMGARVTCTTTREHMFYALDVAPNLLPRAGVLLAEMATDSAFYHWELKSTAYRLMLKDIDLLNRRNLPALSMELLHEAAFGKNPSGCGLGISLFASADRVGTHSIKQLELFQERFLTPSNCSVSLVGYESGEEGLDLLRDIKANLHFRAPQKPAEKSGKIHCFTGGDIRRDLSAATRVYVNFAWPTHGRGCPVRPAYDLAACLLTGSMGRIAYSSRGSKIFGDDALANEGVQAAAFTKAYSDHGIFGISLFGQNAKTTGDRLAYIISALRKTKFTEEELVKAKRIFKANLLMEFESPSILGTDLAIQLSEPRSHYQSPAERVAAIDAITLTQLNEAIAKTASSSCAALSVVGPEAYDVLPLSVLLSA